MLKAYSRVLEHLMLAGDLILVVGCWLLAYVARFYLFGPARVSHDIPPLGPYLIMILPIVVVWGISFQAFDLYRPRRIGSRLSEVADVAKASSLAAVVLVTIMTFLFREYDYSRLVIVYFWLFSIGAVSFARNVFREGMRVARRRGYNLRYGLVVGSGELAQHVIERLRGRPDIGIQVVGVLGDAKEGLGGVPWLGAYADLSAVLATRPVDHVVIALVHEDASRLPGLLDAIGDEPVTIHVVPDLFRFTTLRGGVEEFEGIPFVHLRESPLHGWNAVVKRVFDVVSPSSGRRCGSPPAGPCSTARTAWGWTDRASGCSSSGRWRSMRRPPPGRCGRRRATRGARPSAPFSGASASTSCPSSSTCCAAR